MTLSEYLDDRRAAVDAALAEVLVAPPAAPAVIVDAMRYSLLAGGKRLRPLLVLAACEAVRPGDADGARRLAMPAACALEMIHTYSLVHDDLPAMDNDALRRGRPTSHVVHGDGMAILAGDGLQSEAFALLARRPESDGDPDLQSRKLQTLLLVAEAAGACGMVGGQAIDLDADPTQARGTGRADQPPAVLDEHGLRDMHARKTGALIRAAVLAGGTMGGATAEVAGALDRYAREIGLAFQIVDDILDVEGASSDLGKTAGKDAAAGKPTYVALYGLDRSRTLAAACLARAEAALADAALSDSRLPGLAHWVVHRRT
ncbi:MAG: polyprenyl synthetase family protein [Vicinamibacterales bacterium]